MMVETDKLPTRSLKRRSTRPHRLTHLSGVATLQRRSQALHGVHEPPLYYYSLSLRAVGHTALRARRQRAILARLAVAVAVVQDALLAAPERVVAAHEAGLEAAAVADARGALGLSSVGREG